MIGLSFSPVFPRRMMFSLLRQMRANIPRHIDLWIGGRGTEDFNEAIDGIFILNSADEITSAYQILQLKLSTS
mgnify:FL=1